MRSIEQILQPGDRLLYSGTIHWVVSDRHPAGAGRDGAGGTRETLETVHRLGAA